MSNTEPGAPVAGLHRVDGDGTARRVLSDVMISNGIGWSPDQATMYYIDTLTFRVDRFDYDPDTGEIDGRRPFVTFDGSAGVPDGMCVDAEGCLWVAMFGGFGVQRFSPDGERLETVVTPGAPQTTCCCFGGPDLDTLYITTARDAIAGIDTEGEPNSGWRCSPPPMRRTPARRSLLILSPVGLCLPLYKTHVRPQTRFAG